MSSFRPIAIVIAVLSLVAAACGSGGASTGPSASRAAAPPLETASAESPEPSGPPVPLSVGLGFIPSVQFAPFYLADQAGYYDEAGLDVTFRHGTDYDVVAL